MMLFLAANVYLPSAVVIYCHLLLFVFFVVLTANVGVYILVKCIAICV